MLLGELARMAAAADSVPVALTFAPHPREVLRPREHVPLLTPLRERLRLLRRFGAAETAVVRFTREFAELSPEAFMRELSGVPCETAGFCVGERWRFGRNAAGDAAWLESYCGKHSLLFRSVPELRVGGDVVSSTAIRRAVASGLLLRAKTFLGHPYRLWGIVEHGYRIAGKELKRPTANLAVDDGILPPDGVYAARALVAGIEHPAAVNLGMAPTFGRTDGKRRLEVHVLDFSGNLYGMEIGVELTRYLRPERFFGGAEDLRRQIEKDIATIRKEFLQRKTCDGAADGSPCGDGESRGDDE